jgi:AraC family transcriptional regulator
MCAHLSSSADSSLNALPSAARWVAWERQWRHPSGGFDGPLLVSRWSASPDESQAVHEACVDCHVIAVNLARGDFALTHAGSLLHDGLLLPGATQVTAPGVPVRASFRSAADMLHLYVPQHVLRESFDDAFGERSAQPLVIGDPGFFIDPTIERLARVLADAVEQELVSGPMLITHIALAIVARAVSRHFVRQHQPAAGQAAMPTWRLRRVLDFIESHYAEPIGLQDLANSAGLSRMHFAGLFWRVTGYRPHHFVLRRRIEAACALLKGPEMRVLDVATECGFRTQAHFAVAFRRVMGASPSDWRTAMGYCTRA